MRAAKNSSRPGVLCPLLLVGSPRVKCERMKSAEERAKLAEISQTVNGVIAERKRLLEEDPLVAAEPLLLEEELLEVVVPLLLDEPVLRFWFCEP